MELDRLLSVITPEGGLAIHAVAEVYANQPGDEREKRFHMAGMAGTIDPRMMVFFQETYGMPLADFVLHLRRKGIDWRVDYEMLEHELLCIGKRPSSAKAAVEALRREIETFNGGR